MEIVRSKHADEIGLGPDSKVLCLSTEGATDPESYARIVGHAHAPDVHAKEVS